MELSRVPAWAGAADSTETMSERKAVLIRLDPKVHAAVRRWADYELRSFNAQVEYLLRKALWDAGRQPSRRGEATSDGED